VSSSECQKYAVVHETVAGVDRPTIICSGSLRTRVVYLSQSNSIVIDTYGGATLADDDVTDDVETDDMTRFLLKYQGMIIVLYMSPPCRLSSYKVSKHSAIYVSPLSLKRSNAARV